MAVLKLYCYRMISTTTNKLKVTHKCFLFDSEAMAYAPYLLQIEKDFDKVVVDKVINENGTFEFYNAIGEYNKR